MRLADGVNIQNVFIKCNTKCIRFSSKSVNVMYSNGIFFWGGINSPLGLLKLRKVGYFSVNNNAYDLTVTVDGYHWILRIKWLEEFASSINN